MTDVGCVCVTSVCVNTWPSPPSQTDRSNEGPIAPVVDRLCESIVATVRKVRESCTNALRRKGLTWNVRVRLVTDGRDDELAARKSKKRRHRCVRFVGVWHVCLCRAVVSSCDGGRAPRWRLQ